MGGSAASHNNFWQLFVRPAGATTWRLATPPGVASNGGLILAGLTSGSVLAGFRPSQDLTYSPLATSKDNGRSWSPSSLVAGLADVPNALAAARGSGRLLALLSDGTAETAGPAGTGWARLATRRSLAATTAGTRCGLGRLTAAAFSSSGVPLLASNCARSGTAGIFSYTGRGWQLAGPTLPSSYARQAITVLWLSTSNGRTTALLAAGTGQGTRLLAAWSTGGNAHWTVSAPLQLHGATVTSASSGPDGSVAIIAGRGRAATITSTSGSWQLLPPLPSGAVSLATGSAGGWTALAVHRAQLTVWQAAPAPPPGPAPNSCGYPSPTDHPGDTQPVDRKVSNSVISRPARPESHMHGYTENKNDYLKRLRRIEGQIRGLQRMVEDDKYCIDILTQVAAATKALQSVALGLLEEHLGHCVAGAIAEGGDAATEKVREASDAIARLVKS